MDTRAYPILRPCTGPTRRVRSSCGPLFGRRARSAPLTVRSCGRPLESPTAGLLPPENPFTGPVIDLAERLHSLATPTQRRRLVDAHLSWYLGVAGERAARQQQLTPTLNDYLYTRLLYVAGFSTIAWLQVSQLDDIPDTEINFPAVHALTEMASMVAALDDDLFSYGKELWHASRHPQTTGPILNLVDLYQSYDQCSREEAQRRVVALRDRILARFTEVRDLVLPGAVQALRRYLSDLTCLIRGNYEWGIEVGRYTNPDGRHPGAIKSPARSPTGPAPSARPKASLASDGGGKTCPDWTDCSRRWRS
ncbi:terpene synthase family protein [Nonomuraea sp. JJY05]|uniref:terpene synthase family protein n=1 Tax=Nonomuraea sp. JJY05 TaxID=3350255 RepID=UPI00373E68E0